MNLYWNDCKDCQYARLKYKAKTEGNRLGGHTYKTRKECESICDDTPSCKSFRYVPHEFMSKESWCLLFDKEIVESEPQDKTVSENGEEFTVYKICGNIHIII